MKQPSRAGLFVVGTDTGVGKTRVASRIARALLTSGQNVGVYKPAASGCSLVDGELISDDAVALWEAAGRPGDLAAVCPQRFKAPLAPHLAARADGLEIDASLLRNGLNHWLQRSEVVVVEGAGGLLSPLGDGEYVADLAVEFGLPLVLVAPNKIGVINQVLQTLMAAAYFSPALQFAGIVLNDVLPPGSDDPSISSNRRELEARCSVPLLAQLGYDATEFDRPIDWGSVAHGSGGN